MEQRPGLGRVGRVARALQQQLPAATRQDQCAPELGDVPHRPALHDARPDGMAHAAEHGPRPHELGGVRHAVRSGVMQGRPVGNVSQLGGALVLARGGRELLLQRARNAADTAEPGALLDALAPQSSGAAS